MVTNKKPEHLTKYAMKLVRCKAQQLVGKAGYTRDDIKDIEQDLIKSLLACMPHFDPAKAKINTFVGCVVGSRIADMLRRRNAETRHRGWQDSSLNEEIETQEGPLEIIETLSQDEIDLRTGRYNRPEAERSHLQIDLTAVVAGLPPDLRVVAEMLLTQSIADVARELGIARSSFRKNYLARLRTVFAENRMDDYLL